MEKEKVIERYDLEIGEIHDILRRLEEEKVYGMNSSSKGDGRLSTNARNLKEKFDSLIHKIDNDEPGWNESFKTKGFL